MAMQWYLVHAKTGRETLAEFQLRRQGYETFLPQTLRSVRQGRKIQTVNVAYFPSYLFVSFDMERHEWRPINSTIGVRRLVAAPDGPLPAPRGLVDALKAQTTCQGVLDLTDGLAIGDEIRVIAGPFAHHLGVVERLAPDQRVDVLLSLMNTRVPIRLPRELCAVTG